MKIYGKASPAYDLPASRIKTNGNSAIDLSYNNFFFFFQLLHGRTELVGRGVQRS